MEMALWSSIICLPFLIMYLSLCPIDCGHWMLSLNQFFPEEKWFVYEQSLPLQSMTALAAALKWIRMKPETTGVHGAGHLFSACWSHSIRHACLSPNRRACHILVGRQTQYFLTVAYSSPVFKDGNNFGNLVSPQHKIHWGGGFFSMFAKQQRITLKCFNNMMPGGDVKLWWVTWFLWASQFPPAFSLWPK